MDPDQTAPTGAVSSVSALIVFEASHILVEDKNRHFYLCALRVNKCEFSVHTVRIFMKCTHVCAVQTTYYHFHQIIHRT